MTNISNKTQIRWKMLIPLAVILIVVSFQSVDAVTCSNVTSYACEGTDVTDTVCESGVCKCRGGFPIPTGCARNLAKPVVKLSDQARTNVIVGDVKAAIRCEIDSKDTFTFEWKLNNNLLPDITQEINVAVGTYSCLAKYGSVKVSNSSDPFTITAGTPATNYTLKITGVPPSVASGVNYTVGCSGLPFGSAAIFYLNGTQISMPINYINVGNLTCGMDVVRSQPVPTPTIVSNISSVDVLVSNDKNILDYVYRTGVIVNLTCQSTPSEIYMAVPPVDLNYTFTVTKWDGVTKISLGKTYSPEPNGTYNITCSASYNKEMAVVSPMKTIIFSDNNITPPNITASGTKLLAGSRLVLKCVTDQVGAQYTWTKVGGPTIPLQYDSTIQLDNFILADMGSYYCTVRKNYYEVSSALINITLAANVSKPVITGSENEKTFYETENYILICTTDSATPGMTYSWKRNNTDLVNVNSSRLSITKTSFNDSGIYMCRAKFQGKTSDDSGPLNITVAGAVLGKPCDSTNVKTACVGNEYTKVCNTTSKPYRCICAAGYKPKDQACQKGTAVVSSVFLLVVGVLFSRLK